MLCPAPFGRLRAEFGKACNKETIQIRCNPPCPAIAFQPLANAAWAHKQVQTDKHRVRIWIMLAGLGDKPQFDVIVVGSGAGGMVAALRAHDLGLKVLVI